MEIVVDLCVIRRIIKAYSLAQSYGCPFTKYLIRIRITLISLEIQWATNTCGRVTNI